jgi:hypothetical protein
VANFSLHCDTCGHDEPVSTLTRDMIGKPCPHCTWPMLDEGEYRMGKALQVALPLLRVLGLAKDQPGASYTYRSKTR